MTGPIIRLPGCVLLMEAVCVHKGASNTVKTWGWMLTFSLIVHLVMWTGISWIRMETPQAAIEPVWVTLEPPPPPPAPAPKPVEPPHPDPPPPPAPPKAAKVNPKPVQVKAKQLKVREKKAPMPQSPAVAGQILAKTEPAASTEAPPDAFATGDGDSYAGGYTASSGQSEQPVFEAPSEVKELFEQTEVDQMPVPVVQIKPLYPNRARRLRLDGKVKVRFLTKEDGSVSNIKILDSEPAGVFEDSVLGALACWKFSPGKIKGKAVSTWVVTAIEFKFEDL